jgi:hypothetical protein
MLLVGVFITFLYGLGFWGLHLGHTSVLTKEFDEAPIHPPSLRWPASIL